MHVPDALRSALEAGQRRGSVGPGDVETHVALALAFFAPGAPAPGASCLDLGSGAGLPGLPLALAYPDTRWTLLDAREQRVDDLRRAVRGLSLEPRVTVVHARAEDAGRGELRGTFDIVVARGFGPPARTAEYATPLLRVGGSLMVSTRADGAGWPAAAIPSLALGMPVSWAVAGGSFRCYRLEGALPDRFPRRPHAQARSPLF